MGWGRRPGTDRRELYSGWRAEAVRLIKAKGAQRAMMEEPSGSQGPWRGFGGRGSMMSSDAI